jgi:hypothetical protein
VSNMILVLRKFILRLMVKCLCDGIPARSKMEEVKFCTTPPKLQRSIPETH